MQAQKRCFHRVFEDTWKQLPLQCYMKIDGYFKYFHPRFFFFLISCAFKIHIYANVKEKYTKIPKHVPVMSYHVISNSYVES